MAWSPRWSIAWSLAALPAMTAGWLAESYRIPDAEAQRLVMAPPEVRGDRVRVVQRTMFATEPADLPPPVERPDYGGGPEVDVAVDLHAHGVVGGRARPGPAPRPTTVAPPAGKGGGPSGRSVPAGPTGAGGRRVGGGASLGKLDIGGDAEVAVLLVAAAVMVTGGLVATEGVRYDGWTRLRPEQPVHLMHHDGRQQVLALGDLAPEHLVGRPEVVVAADTGPVSRLGRAPLDRRGWIWRLDGGGIDSLTADGERVPGIGAHLGVGYFPRQPIGLLAFAEVAGGAKGDGDALNLRLGLEADVIPLHVGRFHFGGYGVTGFGFGESAGGSLADASYQATLIGGGALVEVDLATRLALLGRAGVIAETHRGGLSPAAAFTVGFSVY